MPHFGDAVTGFSPDPRECAADSSETRARRYRGRVTFRHGHDIPGAMYPVLLFMVLALFTAYPKLALWLLVMVATMLLRRWW